MTQEFVPLVAGSLPTKSAAGSTRLKPIVAAQEQFEPTKPQSAKVETSPAPPIAHGPPKITLEKQGGTITHIRVECCCGQVTELKCEY
jgi:hypothetical protein